jgi:translocation and assembly module TamB
LAEPAAVQDTRRKAGLLQEAQADGGSGGADFPLDILLSSEQAIFVRGRGLDAEMGGQLRISGSLRNVVPIGEFHLIRGRLDILGKRFVLDQGRIAVQGALVPWISFSATTEQTDYSTTIAIEGEATEPEIRFISSPELPEEEVLARLLFDRGLTNLSPLQAAQLAAAVATLAGKGGGGIINKLREGTGLDDLDISTDAEGTATLRAGKYISENIYTDLAVDSAGKTEINLNLDLTPNLTARGSVGSDGQTGLGVFYEKDY